MNKRKLLEQVERAKAVTLDELKMHNNIVAIYKEQGKNKEARNEAFWSAHQAGHMSLLHCFEYFLNGIKDNQITKNELRKFLKGQRAIYDAKIKMLDEKYNNFENDEDMTIDDEQLYGASDGGSCEATSMLGIVNGKNYYSKDSYEPTDWSDIYKLIKGE